MTGPLIELVGDYLLVRRALGYKLEYTEVVLRQFVAYLAEHDADTITIEHALGFATAPEGASPRWQALRLSAIRCFARCEVLRAGCLQSWRRAAAVEPESVPYRPSRLPERAFAARVRRRSRGTPLAWT